MNGADETVSGKPRIDKVALAYLVATGALLAVATNMAKLASDAGLPALPFLIWSVGGAALLLCLVVAFGSGLPRLDARKAEYFVLAGLVSVAAPNLLLFAAVPHVGAGFAALAIAFPPLFTYAMALALGMERFSALRATGVAVALGMERFSAMRAAGVAVALGGAVLLAVYKFATPDASMVWIIATLTAPVILAIGNIYRTLRWPDDTQPEQLAPGMLIASVLLLLIFAGLSGTGGPLPWQVPASLPIVGAQILVFALQYHLFFVLQKLGGPVYLSLLGSVAAIIGVPIAVLLLGEEWPQGIVIATVLIATGIALVSRRPT